MASQLLAHWNIDAQVLPDLCPSIGVQVKVNAQAAQLLGIPEGIPIAYRGGDQPNNAFSLNVLNPGEVAATRHLRRNLRRYRSKSRRPSIACEYLYMSQTPWMPLAMACWFVSTGQGRSYSWLRQLLGPAVNPSTMDN